VPLFDRHALAVIRDTLNLPAALKASATRAARLEEALRLLAEARGRVMAAHDAQRMMQQVCDLLLASGRYAMIWIGLTGEGDQIVHPALLAGVENGDREDGTVTWDDSPTGRGPTGTALRMGRPDIVADIARDSRYEPWRERALARGCRSSAAIPMRSSGSVVGALNVYASSADAFDKEAIGLLQGIADELAGGLARLQADEQRIARMRELEAIRDLVADLTSDQESPALLKKVVEGAAKLLGGCGSAVYLCESGEQVARRVATYGALPEAAGGSHPFGQGAAGHVARRREAMILPDGRSWPEQAEDSAGNAPMGGLASVPMLWEGEVMGVIHVLRGEAAPPFTRADLDLLQLFANQAALALRNANLMEAERRHIRVLEAVRQAGLSLTSTLDLGPVLEAVLEHALRLVAADDGHVFLYDGERLTFVAARWSDRSKRRPYAAPRPGGITYTVAQTGEAMVIPDVDSHPIFEGDRWGGAIVSLPLRIGERVLGVMNVACLKPHHFGDEELEALRMLADQAAAGIQNAQLFSEADAERQRLRLLYGILRELSVLQDPREILERAVTLTTQELAGLSGMAFLYEPTSGRLRLQAAYQLDETPLEALDKKLDLRLGKGLSGWVAQHRVPALVPDVLTDERWQRVEPGGQGGSAISSPILIGDRLLGVLTVLSDRPFQKEHLELEEAISRQVALALSNAERFRQVERRLRELEALRQVAQVTNRRLEMQTLLEEVCQQVAHVLGYRDVEILLVEGDDLVMRAARGEERASGQRIPLTDGIVGRVARNGQAAFAPDVRLDPDYVEAIPGTQSEIVVPLRKGGVVIGVLNVESPERQGLTVDDLHLLSLLGDQLSVAIENAALYDRLSQHSSELETMVAERTTKLAVALEQARQADRLKTRFVADVSHELRTPLTNIRLYLELLPHAPPGRYEEYLETLNRETERLVALIEDLLTISRMDAGTAVPQPAVLDLNELVHALVEDRHRLFAERHLSLAFSPEPGLPQVNVDARMMAQVIANLMTNAMNYTPGGGSVSISTSRQQLDGRLWGTLTVADSGLGIGDEERPRVFERFYRGTASRMMGTPGTGLGLSICREILARHGGRITFESQAGKGSAFTVWLPAVGN
jgi:GAF domain-containing protein